MNYLFLPLFFWFMIHELAFFNNQDSEDEKLTIDQPDEPPTKKVTIMYTII